MNRKLKEPIELDRDADLESAEKVLLEIEEDARRLNNRYPKETIVPEGGE